MGKFHSRPSEEQQEEFLRHIADGKTRQEAAEAVEATSTQFRTFINGHSDESLAFAERYLAVLTEAGKAPSPFATQIREQESVQLAHRLLDETIMRALDSERGKVGASNRVLYQLNLLNLESFRPLLEARTRHIHEGAVGVYAMPTVDTDLWTLEQHREFVALRERLAELLAIAAPQNTSMLELPEGEIIDAEASEVAVA